MRGASLLRSCDTSESSALPATASVISIVKEQRNLALAYFFLPVMFTHSQTIENTGRVKPKELKSCVLY